jgi:hypothetical protein
MVVRWSEVVLEHVNFCMGLGDWCTVTAWVQAPDSDAVIRRLLRKEKTSLTVDGKSVGDFCCIEVGPSELGISLQRPVATVRLSGMLQPAAHPGEA